MNKRNAKKFATLELAAAARRASEGGPGAYPPRDWLKIVNAYRELADELDRRYDRRPSARSFVDDPAQLPLFPEADDACPPDPAPTADGPTPRTAP